MDDPVRGAVGLFHGEEKILNAVDELLALGFDRADLGVLADHRTIRRRLGHDYGKVTELEDVPLLAAEPYVSKDSRVEGNGVLVGAPFYVGAVAAAAAAVASGASLTLVLIESLAAGAACGLLGLGAVHLIRRRHAQYIRDHLDHGGLLLWVHADTPERERLACDVLRHHADQAHMLELPKLAYRTDGGVSRNLSFMNRLGL